MVDFSLSLLLILLILACSGPEEKKALFFKRATELYAQGDLSRALLEIRNALVIDSRFAEAHLLLARIEIKSGKLCEAFRSFSNAAVINPHIEDAQIGIGKIFLITGSADKALERAEFVLERNPRNRSALFLKGAALLASKEAASAVKVFEELIEEGGTLPNTYLLLGMALAEQGEWVGAEKALTKGIAANPDFAPLRIGFARIQAAFEKKKEAESDRSEAVRIATRPPEVSFALFAYRRHSDRIEDAGSPAEEFSSFEPSAEVACEAASRFLATKKDALRAVTFLEKAVSRLPSSTQLRFLLSELLFNSGSRKLEAEISETCFRVAQESFDPALLQAPTALARTHVLLRRSEPAELALEEILQADNRSNKGLHLNENIHLLKGEPLQAVLAYDVIEAGQPDFIPAHYCPKSISR